MAEEVAKREEERSKKANADTTFKFEKLRVLMDPSINFISNYVKDQMKKFPLADESLSKAIVQDATSAWERMPDEERRKWEENADGTYQYCGVADTSSNPFVIFMDSYINKQLSKSCPPFGYSGHTILQNAKAEWASMTDDEKAPFLERAAANKAEWVADIEAYLERQKNLNTTGAETSVDTV